MAPDDRRHEAAEEGVSVRAAGRKGRRLALASIPVLLLSACASVGPATVQRDRFDYSTAVADSWKQQLLQNIVRLRYGDNAVFVDVAQIVSGYTFQGTLTAGVGRNSPFGGYDSGSLSGQGVFIDRPTITYVPLTGQQFMRGLSTPIAPSAVLFLMQAGYPADAMMRMSLDSINGRRNRTWSPARVHPGDPEFTRAIELIRDAQRSGEVGMRVDVDRANRATTILTFGRRAEGGQARPAAAELAALLGLQPGADEYVVTYGRLAGGGRDIDLNTRSLLQILAEFAAMVEVPQAHLDDGSVYPSPPFADERPPLRVRSGASRPADPFTAVRYGGYWYWIERNDLESKRAFSFLIGLFNFMETGKAETLPLVTIPAQ
jgi:hypothetical protein